MIREAVGPGFEGDIPADTPVHVFAAAFLPRAMGVTEVFKDISMAIMTSRDNADPALTTDLPPGVVIVNSGTGFASSFAEAVTKFNLG